MGELPLEEINVGLVEQVRSLESSHSLVSCLDR